MEQNGASKYDLIAAELIGTLDDIDGHTYKWVRIGDNYWMTENLQTTTYNDGKQILNITDGTEWATSQNGAYCWYDNDSNTYAQAYGAIYNGFAVNTDILCPVGWHVPTDDDWTALTDYLGGISAAGGKLKSIRTEPELHPRWDDPNNSATNETGFSALPGGSRDFIGNFDQIGRYGYWWSSTVSFMPTAWYRFIGYDHSNIYRNDYDMFWGFSVRCIRDVD